MNHHRKSSWQIFATGLCALGLQATEARAERETQIVPNIDLHWSYQDAQSLDWTRRQVSSVPEVYPLVGVQGLMASDQVMGQTLFLVRLSDAISRALEQAEKITVAAAVNPSLFIEKRQAIAADLKKTLDSLRSQFQGPSLALTDTVKLVEMLIDNLHRPPNPRPIPWIPGSPINPVGFPGEFTTTRVLAVGAGGSQDSGHFRQLIKAGKVPPAKSFVPEGFMHEFALQPGSSPACPDRLCVYPHVAFEQHSNGKNSLYVSLHFATNVRPETFTRPPLNLALVVDVSGSMEAHDGTEQSRVEWAKDLAKRAVNSMNPNDHISLVVFNTTSTVLVPSQPVDDRKAIIKQIEALKADGTTNLEAGLRDGFEQAILAEDDRTESRVLLISDAGLNTGVTDESSLVRLVQEFATEGVGLTAIGLGENFHEELIRGITATRGANYLFAQNGERLKEFAQDFSLLVTPLAYSFRAGLELPGFSGKLRRVVGVPADSQSEARNLIGISTLFLCGRGGGAIVLEYETSDE